MKKLVKISVFAVIGLLSNTVTAFQSTPDRSNKVFGDICSVAPWACGMTISGGNGDGFEPEKPKPIEK
ncbi:hypothetical protein OCL06_14685 [Alteromonas sp. ASW11-19]|uniref:Uncharacterized protein n=1 Tax=Alteromonas salexigens TaxID=2982530 RepID=A0ABT2VS12_9ALTE|nr:hypothetical protein [Alteromonas salexigens]MCU7555834.1 hypothetical protein [Alteromonas salexigens]